MTRNPNIATVFAIAVLVCAAVGGCGHNAASPESKVPADPAAAAAKDGQARAAAMDQQFKNSGPASK